MLGNVTQGLDRAMDVFMMVVALGCLWLGCRAVLRPRRRLEPIRGPVWAVCAWGLGFVLLGMPLVIETVTLMGGGEPGRTADVIRWVAGPLVVGSIVGAFLARGWQRHRAQTVKGGRRA